ncbi:ABC transporter ATP-binding protein [Pseudochrobactrum kiredjianiae]|uniref:ABC transporter ATP-binding protein n=1 Tax=Pseudochrobactrum kiredjianiae TaxID=386305 RepID=A0ABW3V1V9_9HYPH|nr:ABC transporter ATP-binding protein [Pseudochrobactrum kiredjianiae]MDM7852421.1 ABC transporter ATP-binding protein [Pseudochrobactrum kiredjianiae]
MSDQPILQLNNLSIALRHKEQDYPAVSQMNFSIQAGEVFGLVGESGCGKSLSALTIAGLLRPPLHVTQGKVLLEGQDINRLSNRDMRRLRGDRVAMIFQEPMTSLNPLMTIGDQIGEMFVLHKGMSVRQARLKAIEALEQVQVPSPERRIKDYPHQLSGGMRQRVMIAIALACDPALLIADEPTTALDVTIQAEIVELILELCKARGTAVLMISHDLGLVARMCDRVAVMYAGHIVEQRPASQIFTDPRHPYTRGLVASLPLLGRRLQEGRKKLTEIKGVVPGLLERDEACGFASRCPRASEQCRTLMPPVTALEGISTIRCYHHD